MPHEPRWVWFIVEDGEHFIDQAFSREEAEELLKANPERKLEIAEPVFI
jgi:hypothetical protein